MKRDKHKDDELRKIGWIPLHFWGNTVKNNVDYCIELIHFYIKYNNDL